MTGMGHNIGYHTRLYADNTVKVSGGSFGGSLDMETVNRLMRMFTVIVKLSGTAVLVDSEGREVRLYLSVDADKTVKGQAALAAWRAEREKVQREEEERAEQQREELHELVDRLGHDEAMRRLKGRS